MAKIPIAFGDTQFACKQELKELCPEEKKKFICLYENYEKASPLCKEELDRASGVAKISGVRGGGGLNAFGPVAGALGLMGANRTVIRYSGSYALEPTPITILQNSLHISTPVRSNDKETLAFNFTSSRTSFENKVPFAQLKTSGYLDRIEVGGQFTKRIGEGKSWGVRANVGSASDKVFHSKEEMTVSLSAFLTKPGKENNYWVYTVFASNNSPILNYIPIPGFIYFHRTQTVTGMFGLPLMNVQWTPVDPWIFSFSLILVNVNMEAAYGHRNEFQVFSGFSTQQHSYLRADRENKNDRLFFQERKLYVGARSPLFKVLMSELQVGESFDRKLSEGRSFNKADSEANLGRSIYASVSLAMMF